MPSPGTHQIDGSGFNAMHALAQILNAGTGRRPHRPAVSGDVGGRPRRRDRPQDKSWCCRLRRLALWHRSEDLIHRYYLGVSITSIKPGKRRLRAPTPFSCPTTRPKSTQSPYLEDDRTDFFSSLALGPWPRSRCPPGSSSWFRGTLPVACLVLLLVLSACSPIGIAPSLRVALVASLYAMSTVTGSDLPSRVCVRSTCGCRRPTLGRRNLAMHPPCRTPERP